MTATTKVPLGASTTVRKWYLDVNTGTVDAPVWTGVFGITNFQPALTPGLQDDSDFDSQGYGSQTATKLDWSLTATVSRKSQADAPTAYDPGQEALRLIANNLGVDNRIQVRWYEMEPGGPRVEAYSGFGVVTWSPQGGAMDALDTVQVVINGQGQRTAIAHPDASADVPVINSLSPTTVAAAGGDEVVINGDYLTGATAGTGGGTPLATTPWALGGDGEIVFAAPAHAAGNVMVTVTTSAGTSNSKQLTYS